MNACETAKKTKQEHTFEDVPSIFAEAVVLRKREGKGGAGWIVGQTDLRVFQVL